MVNDGTNILWTQTFQLYKGFYRKSTKLGLFIKGSTRVVKPPKQEYKGFKFKYFKKGDIIRMLITRQKYNIYRFDGSVFKTKKNTSLILKKKTRYSIKIFLWSRDPTIKSKTFFSII